MKILLVTTMFPPYCGGGVSSHVRDLSAALSAAGEDVWILSSRRRMAFDPREGNGSVGTARVVFCPDFVHMFPAIKRLLARRTFDVVHFHSFNALALSFLGGNPGGAVVFTAHCDTANYFASLHGWDRRTHPAYRLLRWYENRAVRTPDATITVSRRLRDYVEAIGGSNVVFIPNAVDCDYWTPLPSEEEPSGAGPMILVPRMLVPTSGVEHAILSMPSILSTIPDASMVIAGDGPLRASLEGLASRIGNGSIHFEGEVPRHRMRDLYRRATAVLVPSITSAGVQDATSIAALEAMACGRPVIASNIGGLPEAITHGRQGLLVPEQDPEAIANAATALLTDRPAAVRLGAEARRRVLEEFSLTTWVERVSAVYSSATDSVRGG